MTRSELMATMTGGMATIAGSVMAASIAMGVPASHLLAASIMGAAAGLVMAKLMVPETEVSGGALVVGDLSLDPEEHRVVLDGGEVALPLKEFELLHLLMSNPGRVLTREVLIDRVWGSDYVGDTKTLDVHVKRLRAKIEPDPANPTRITTIRGLGYKLERPKA
jgi:DNA-binding response OmpR family regulator